MPSTPASADISGATPVLSLSGFSVTFDTPQGQVRAVQDVALSVSRGECLGVVGESGAGKSQLFLAVMGLLAANGRAAGSARLGAQELLGLPAAALDRVRGAKVGMVFQDPMTRRTSRSASSSSRCCVATAGSPVPQRVSALGRFSSACT
jgi:ABC-type glutathione transport system ATPase component